MTPDQAAWVRNKAWTAPARREGRHPQSMIAGMCLCQTPFTTANCSGGDHSDCAEPHTVAPATALVGATGVLYWPNGHPVAVWHADRQCGHRCGCGCHGGSVPALTQARPSAVQLDLFATA